MQRMPVRVVCATLLITGIGAAASAAPSFHSSLRRAVKAVQSDSDGTTRVPYDWALSSVIQSGLVQQGISFFAGDTYANYQGRTFELKQEQVKLGITDMVELFYGRQFTLAKGHSQTSRFYGDDDYYGGRVVVKKPNAEDASAFSLQFEALRPGTAQLSTASSRESLSGTKNNSFSVNYGDRSKNQFQLSYTTIEAPAVYNARSYSVGVGRDFDLGSNILGRLQGALVAQSFTGAATHSNYEMKSILSGSLAVTATPWLTLEGSITALPNGMPFASGEFTGVSSFAIYEPGGIVDDLRSKFLAFGSVRLMAHWKF